MRQSWNSVRVQFLFVFLMVFMFVTTAHTGWIIEQQNELDGSIETLYIQANKMKIVGVDDIFILDIQSEILSIVNTQRKIYFQGSPSQLVAKNGPSMLEVMQDKLEELNAEERELAGKYIEQVEKEILRTRIDRVTALPSVFVKNNGEDGSIAGYPVNRFDVYVDGTCFESLWISEEVTVHHELDMNKLMPFLDAMSGANQSVSYVDSDEYLALLNKGYPLKSIEGDGLPVTAIRVIQSEISEAEFLIPKTYRRVDLSELMADELTDVE